MESDMEFHTARALLEWQIDLGATEAIGESPINCYELPAKSPNQKSKNAPKRGQGAGSNTASTNAPAIPKKASVDLVAIARDIAGAAKDLAGLQDALAGFEHCELKKGAHSLVFADGVVGAKIMVIGDAPGRDEDRVGKPFVGPAGRLLDVMFAAIDHGRDHSTNPIYITNILPWRPPQNRDPNFDEIAMLLPFVKRHVELAKPDILILMGNISCQALLGRSGITKLRGDWLEALGKPALAMFHPAYLLRKPIAKREAWYDLLMLQKRVRG